MSGHHRGPVGSGRLVLCVCVYSKNIAKKKKVEYILQPLPLFTTFSHHETGGDLKKQWSPTPGPRTGTGQLGPLL